MRLDREQHNSGAAAANTMLAAKTRATANRVDRTVKPAAAVSSKIPPPRNWSLAPGAQARFVARSRSNTGGITGSRGPVKTAAVANLSLFDRPDNLSPLDSAFDSPQRKTTFALWP